ncbi:YdcF family protein [Nocardia mangyaensis]|uniref:YdcF family protein n=1 Tax=Nocardia mangyaensis TaxID=2213200 RepID=UPI0026763B67|nr:YdcF family protein [Nocardia mangyaensis]MDO3648232.1 YdcF family protein [Nocardia mangyaensis]
MTVSFRPGAGDAAAAAGRQIAERASRALTAGGSGIGRSWHGVARMPREAAGVLVHTDRSTAIPIDSAGQALIRDDQLIGGRSQAVYADWLRNLKARGVDSDRAISDLGTVWDFLRRDPKWAFDTRRPYGGVVMFGSPDSGGSAVLANFIRARGLEDTPVVFSGYADPGKGARIPEAVRFRREAEQVGLGSRRVLEDHAARNTGENVANSLALLREQGQDVRSIVGVCTPQHARRVWGTIMKQGPDVEHAAIVSADVSVDNYLHYGLRDDRSQMTPPDDITSAILGEIKRLDAYPAEGHIVAQEVPNDVRAAYDRLSEVFRPSERRF